MEHDADVVAIGMGTGPGGDSAPAVILAVREEYVPIFVSPGQARSIGMAVEGEPFERPLAHDLLLELLTEFGGAVNRVRIDDLIDGTFYAKVDVERYDEGRPARFVFDARPSDALALAVRVDCPVVVTEEVVEKAGQSPETVGFGETDPRIEESEEDVTGGLEEEFEETLGREIGEEAGESVEEGLEEETDEGREGEFDEGRESRGRGGEFDEGSVGEGRGGQADEGDDEDEDDESGDQA